MKVARQFIAWNRGKNDPSRMGRCDRDVEFAKGHGVERHDCDVNHTVPYGTGPLCGVFQAINCLATIIPSLRDNKPSTPAHIFDSTPPIEDEDSDSTELAEVLPDEASGLQASNFSG
jgi:hypothetical protein